MGPCISGDVCMDKWVPLVLLDKLTRKAHVEVDAVRGVCKKPARAHAELVVTAAAETETDAG